MATVMERSIHIMTKILYMQAMHVAVTVFVVTAI